MLGTPFGAIVTRAYLPFRWPGTTLKQNEDRRLSGPCFLEKTSFIALG
jgi:hypothetical protein